VVGSWRGGCALRPWSESGVCRMMVGGAGSTDFCYPWSAAIGNWDE